MRASVRNSWTNKELWTTQVDVDRKCTFFGLHRGQSLAKSPQTPTSQYVSLITHLTGHRTMEIVWVERQRRAALFCRDTAEPKKICKKTSEMRKTVGANDLTSHNLMRLHWDKRWKGNYAKVIAWCTGNGATHLIVHRIPLQGRLILLT